MIRQQAGQYGRLAVTAAAVLAGSVSGPAAYARDHHNGNGHHNRNTISYRSPTYNRGYQHTSNSNAGGTNPVQNALCRHSYVCHVTQHITIVRPETPPEPAPPAQIVERAPEPAPAASPFLSIGTNGIVFGAPGGTRNLMFPFSFGLFG